MIVKGCDHMFFRFSLFIHRSFIYAPQNAIWAFALLFVSNIFLECLIFWYFKNISKKLEIQKTIWFIYGFHMIITPNSRFIEIGVKGFEVWVSAVVFFLRKIRQNRHCLMTENIVDSCICLNFNLIKGLPSFKIKLVFS